MSVFCGALPCCSVLPKQGCCFTHAQVASLGTSRNPPPLLLQHDESSRQPPSGGQLSSTITGLFRCCLSTPLLPLLMWMMISAAAINNTARATNVDIGPVTAWLGGTAAGKVNGDGTAAKFTTAGGIVLDATSNNLYISEEHGVVRKVPPPNPDSPRRTRMNVPCDMVISSDGSVMYIAELGSNSIRKVVMVDASNSRFAGSGTFGSDEWPRAGRQFPRRLVLDGSNLYVAESAGCRVRTVNMSPTAMVSTLAGTTGCGYLDGPQATAMLGDMRGLAGHADLLYVSDRLPTYSDRLQNHGAVVTIAGQTTSGGADGDGTAAQFNRPHGVAVNPAGTH